MTQNINYQPNEFELADILNLWKKQLKLEMNCHHIGTIQAFNPVTQTAQATVNYTKSFLKFTGTGNTTITTPSYPMLIDCPCIVLGGGGGALTFPIQAGDECLILFNDRNFSAWYNGSSSSPPPTGSLHSFSDAIILVGLRSLSNVLVDYATDAVTLQYSGNTIKIMADSVLVNLAPDVSLELSSTGTLQVNNSVGELIASLYQLMTDIQNATTNTMFGPQPLIMPTFTTDLAVLDSFKG